MHRNLSKIIYLIVCFVFFLFSDLYLSNLLVSEINNGLSIHNQVFALNYIQNTGAAFSLLRDSREFLIILSCVAIVLFFVYVFSTCTWGQKLHKLCSQPLLYSRFQRPTKPTDDRSYPHRRYAY